MSEKVYLVASNKDWHKPMFEELAERRAGKWLWCNTASQLKRLCEQLTPEYIFFLHWSSNVPEEVWLNNECVCFHMTDLPFGRGGSPLQNLIARGFKTTKLSAFRVNGELDGGPIYTKRKLQLKGSALDIYLEAGRISCEIVEWIIDTSPKPQKQSGKAVAFRRRKPEESELPRDKNLTILYDHIRMLDAPGYPKAFLNAKGLKLTFSGAVLDENKLTAFVEFETTKESDADDG